MKPEINKSKKIILCISDKDIIFILYQKERKKKKRYGIIDTFFLVYNFKIFLILCFYQFFLHEFSLMTSKIMVG